MSGKEKNYKTCSRLITLVVSDVPHYTCHFPEKDLSINPLNAELNPICHLLALLGARHILRINILIVIKNKHTVSGICTLGM
jgi:hypothetical protein